MELLKGKRAVAAGIVYLQDEKYEFETKENGRTWSVYGSPVRQLDLFELVRLNERGHSGVRGSTTGLSIISEAQTLKVRTHLYISISIPFPYPFHQSRARV